MPGGGVGARERPGGTDFLDEVAVGVESAHREGGAGAGVQGDFRRHDLQMRDLARGLFDRGFEPAGLLTPSFKPMHRVSSLVEK